MDTFIKLSIAAAAGILFVVLLTNIARWVVLMRLDTSKRRMLKELEKLVREINETKNMSMRESAETHIIRLVLDFSMRSTSLPSGTRILRELASHSDSPRLHMVIGRAEEVLSERFREVSMSPENESPHRSRYEEKNRRAESSTRRG